MVKASPLLSNKPVIYAANLSEADFTGDIEKNEQYKAVCEIAKAENCYRLILMTGSKLESTLNFYRRAGYDDKEKTGFILHLD